MAKSGGHARGGKRARPVRGARGGSKTPPRAASSTGKKSARSVASPTTPEAPITGTFTLGAIAGATPGKWIDTWKSRMPAAPLELVALPLDQQREALMSGLVDVALVRLPLNRDDLHVIPLYEDQPVVVTFVDSSLTAADDIGLDDLAGEVQIISRDAVFRLQIDGALAPSFPAPESTEAAFETIAAGIGFMVAPLSLARLHRRKDLTYRALRGVEASTVALAWPIDATTPAVEAFAGIVRGRTARSSRG